MWRRACIFLAVASLSLVAAESEAQKLELKLAVDGKQQKSKSLDDVVQAVEKRLFGSGSGSFDLEVGSQTEDAIEDALVNVLSDLQPTAAGSNKGKADKDVGDEEKEEEDENTVVKHKKAKHKKAKRAKKEDEENEEEEAVVVSTKKDKPRKKEHKSKKHDKGLIDDLASQAGDALDTINEGVHHVINKTNNALERAVNKTGEALERTFGSSSGSESAEEIVVDTKNKTEQPSKLDTLASKAGEALSTVGDSIHKAVNKTNQALETAANKTGEAIKHVFHGSSTSSSSSGSASVSASAAPTDVNVKATALSQSSPANSKMGLQTIAIVGSIVGALVGVVVVAMVALVNRNRSDTEETEAALGDDATSDNGEADPEAQNEHEEKEKDSNNDAAEETEGKFEGNV